MKATHSNTIIATLIALGGEKKPVDIEILTVGCFKAFPSLFSMDKFKEYPRIDRVKNRIKDLYHAGYIKETKNNHYELTDNISEWKKENTILYTRVKEVLSKEDIKLIKKSNLDDVELTREISSLKKTEAYKKYRNKESMSIVDFLSFLKTDIYMNKTIYDRKMKKTQSICNQDEELNKLFTLLQNKFGETYSELKKRIGEVM